MLNLITKEEMERRGAILVGPIAEGQTPEEAAGQLEKIFGKKMDYYAVVLYEQPIRSSNAMYPVTIGSVYLGIDTDRFAIAEKTIEEILRDNKAEGRTLDC